MMTSKIENFKNFNLKKEFEVKNDLGGYCKKKEDEEKYFNYRKVSD